MHTLPPDDELSLLRALVRVGEMADAVLEDCLTRSLGLAAALDVYLAEGARLLGAEGAFVQLHGREKPVLERVHGAFPLTVAEAASVRGVAPTGDGRTLFVARLEMGQVALGSFGLVLEGDFAGGTDTVLRLVQAMADRLDGTVLALLALSEGRSVLDRLDELDADTLVRPRARFGKYELVAPLGTGGMAQVLVARTWGPEGLGKLVALKRILPHLSHDAAMVEQFLDEARVALRLAHPNLVSVHDFGELGGTHYIAMELVRGVDLDMLIQSPLGPLMAPVAAGVLAQALAGLHAAHEVRGEDGALLHLVHRDLSPHNLMVGFDGQVKLLDFGVAKARRQRTVTVPGIVKGKPLYMSPEQALGERVDRRSDLFAMGLILHEAMTGRRPFDRGAEMATMEAIVEEPVARPKEISLPLWEVASRALEKDPARRYATAEEMARALLEVVEPIGEGELGPLVSFYFPRELKAVGSWERQAGEAPATVTRPALTGRRP
ncbi:MAG: serine/threonine protein kinase [Myxococcaceae bacterium]|nr:serine/threonine protein kinase [Myxococcaceae bacterium]MCI0671675.1 serine/threonine protein kinase [Myxococcaceae bacterium]